MIGEGRYNGSAAFLNSVSDAAGPPNVPPVAAPVEAASMTPSPGEADVLAAIVKDQVSDLNSLSSELSFTPEQVKPVLDHLVSENFVELGKNELKLSPYGERALRYRKMTK